VSGLLVLAVGGVAVAFERSTPDQGPSAAEVVAFYTTTGSRC
jgi:hypothetical protein